jgi:hypothetical protein
MYLAKNPAHRNAGNRRDHVTSHRGDLNKFLSGEVQNLCDNCHKKTKQRGYSTAVDDDDWPLDPNHGANR